MTRSTTATPPIGSRKLNQSHRLRMANLATERFRSPKDRELEAAARQNLIDTIYAAATAIPKRELEVLKKHGYLIEVKGFDLPGYLTMQDAGTREFELPDGTKVVREGGKTRSIRRPYMETNELPGHFPSWVKATQMTPDRSDKTDYYDKNDRITLPKPVWLPGDTVLSDGHHDISDATSRNSRSDKEITRKFDVRGLQSAFLDANCLTAMAAYYAEADRRITTERRLICAAIKVIASCDVYGQALDFWPEVAELESSLFSDVIPNAFSMVTLSDEDKAMLCSNMGERGVTSAICERRAA